MACVTKKRGRWAVDFYDQYGMRRLKVLPKGSTKGQARKLLREIEAQVERRAFIPTKKVPVFRTVVEKWLEYKKPNLRPQRGRSTRATPATTSATFQGLKINRINTTRAEKYITDRQLDGMNILTLRKVLVFLNQVLAYAVRHGYMDYYPLRDAERPRARSNRGNTDKGLDPR